MDYFKRRETASEIPPGRADSMNVRVGSKRIFRRIYVYIALTDRPRHAKTYLLAYADSEDPDHPILIRAV